MSLRLGQGVLLGNFWLDNNSGHAMIPFGLVETELEVAVMVEFECFVLLESKLVVLVVMVSFLTY